MNTILKRIVSSYIIKTEELSSVKKMYKVVIIDEYGDEFTLGDIYAETNQQKLARARALLIKHIKTPLWANV